MAGLTEPQRLISVSLGKIAQSRSQKTGINLHKNLLVATVLHKARTAYMMEAYPQYQQLVMSRRPAAEPMVENSNKDTSESDQTVPSQEMNQHSCSVTQSAPLPACHAAASETRSPSESCESDASAPGVDKENEPPCGRHVPDDSSLVSSSSSSSSCDSSSDAMGHLRAANQLSADAQAASSSADYVNKQNQHGNTCGGVLKRRRENVSEQGLEMGVSNPKKLRVSCDLDTSENEDSRDSSEPMCTDSPQISNLVNIFNSGFSGLCASDNTQTVDLSCHQQQQQQQVQTAPSYVPDASANSYTMLKTVSFAQKLVETPCSQQVGRLTGMPAAIALSV